MLVWKCCNNCTCTPVINRSAGCSNNPPASSGASALIRPVAKSWPVMRVCRLFTLNIKLVRLLTSPIRRRNKSRTARHLRSHI